MGDNFKLKYLKYKSKYLLNKNKLMTGGGEENSSNNNLLLFKADWCGHCKNFLPVWNKISNDSTLNVNFKIFDSENNKSDMKKYNIQGFPTLLFQVNNNIIEYSGSKDEQSIRDFILSYNK